MAASMMTMRTILFTALCALPLVALAQVLQDPTRPPLEIGTGSGTGSMNTHMAPANSKGLLSVIVSPTRCAAIIDGKTIRLGEKYGDTTLVEVSAHGVVLQGAQGRRSMELFPRVGVNVTAAQPAQQSVSCKLEQNFENRKSATQSPGQFGLKEKK